MGSSQPRIAASLAFALMAALGVSGARAQSEAPVKVGIVGPLTGPFATTGVAFRQGIDSYVALNGDKAGGRKVEVIFRDSTANPALAKTLTEELLVKDKVQMLGGYMLTPEAVAAVPVVNETKTPLFLFNASTPVLLKMSPYYMRMGQHMNIPAELGATWSRQQGKSRGYVAVADYLPGHVVEAAFVAKFEAEGGKIVGKDRIPLNTVDFAPFAERIANANPDVLEVFITPGAPAVGFIKALAARGLTQKILIIGQGEAEDNDLHLFDDSVLNFHSIIYLAGSLDNPENKALRAKLHEKFGPQAEPSAFTVGAFDGLHVMYRMVENLAGKPFDGDAAIKSVLGYSWQSPRGPVTINPNRELIENFYVRRVEKVGGRMQNTVIHTFPAVEPPPPLK